MNVLVSDDRSFRHRPEQLQEFVSNLLQARAGDRSSAFESINDGLGVPADFESGELHVACHFTKHQGAAEFGELARLASEELGLLAEARARCGVRHWGGAASKNHSPAASGAWIALTAPVKVASGLLHGLTCRAYPFPGWGVRKASAAVAKRKGAAFGVT